MVKRKKKCSICTQDFYENDLYPNMLIRDTLFNTILHKRPDITREGYICYPDLRSCNADHYTRLLEEDRGQLSHLEKEVIDSIKKQEFISENPNEEFDETLTFGEKVADQLARFGGSWIFIISFLVVLIVWMGMNTYFVVTEKFDPYPFILLNLVLSSLAAIQAPVILMSQNRQAAKDRIQTEQDYMVNLKAELQIRQLNSRLDVFIKQHWQMMNEFYQTQDELLSQMGNSKRISKNN